MSEQTVTVPTSGVITLNVALASGSTIYNSSDSSAIWVSDSPGLSAGIGMRIGPKGSLQWTTDKVACYAVADNLVTAPISVTISDNVAQLVNPVDIGVAVATQLLSTGVPSVLTGNFVGNASLPDHLYVGNYASIQYQFTVFAPGTIALGFSTPNPVSGGDMSMGGRTLVMAQSGVYSISIPVNGPYFTVTPLGGLNVKAHLIYGSNRQTTFNVYPNSYGVRATFFQALVSGTVYPFSQALISSGGNFNARFTVAVPSGTGKGYFSANVTDQTTNNIYSSVIADTTQFHVRPDSTTVIEYYTQLTLPPGVITFSFTSNLTVAATAVNLNLLSDQ